MKLKYMTKTFTLFTILFAMTLLASGPAFAWTVSTNFENGQVGAKAQGSSGFNEAGSATIFSSEKSASGTKSAKMTWPKGSDGWAVAHGFIDYPNIGNGSEIWARGFFYFSSPWSWACSPVIKVLRGAHVANSGGGNVGYHSVFADGSGDILLSNEPGDAQISTRVKFDIDKWQCIEMYVKLSTSDPIFRIWKNGTLIYEDRSHLTLRSSSDYADFAYIMTYWNGGAPQVQTQFVDDFIITNERPSKVDNKGNPMIGPGAWTGGGGDVNNPSAPTGLKVIQ